MWVCFTVMVNSFLLPFNFFTTVDGFASLIAVGGCHVDRVGRRELRVLIPSPNRKKPRCLMAPRPGNGSGFEAKYVGLTVYRSVLESARVACTPVYGASVIARLTDR